MSFRQALNSRPILTTVVVVAVSAAALLVAGMTVFGGRAPGQAATMAFFTVDDGQSWFADDINKIPPFEKDGKAAVRVYVFRCGSGRPFAAYLQRYTPEGKKAIEEARRKAEAENSSPPDLIFMARLAKTAGEVKKPGGNW